MRPNILSLQASTWLLAVVFRGPYVSCFVFLLEYRRLWLATPWQLPAVNLTHPRSSQTFPRFAPSWLRWMHMLLTALVAAQSQQRLPSMWHFATCNSNGWKVRTSRSLNSIWRFWTHEHWTLISFPNHMLCPNGNRCQVSKFMPSATTASVLKHKNKCKCCGLGAERNLFLNYRYSCASHSVTPLCLRKLKTQSPPPQGIALRLAGQQSWICQSINLQWMRSIFVVLEQN